MDVTKQCRVQELVCFENWGTHNVFFSSNYRKLTSYPINSQESGYDVLYEKFYSHSKNPSPLKQSISSSSDDKNLYAC
jgi:hypothetical protein